MAWKTTETTSAWATAYANWRLNWRRKNGRGNLLLMMWKFIGSWSRAPLLPSEHTDRLYRFHFTSIQSSSIIGRKHRLHRHSYALLHPPELVFSKQRLCLMSWLRKLSLRRMMLSMLLVVHLLVENYIFDEKLIFCCLIKSNEMK